ncbi:LOW QUALITY PROTEIN: atypical chemokine receptor 1 [Erythrolamprus reginae]|uniref:LOW QUALITY PROTEIN: atypical chemokine receptor 1 n=1 Tax=Erythrolamprus reginae TaxID=121349 RepID=UPI00396CD85B
MGNCVHTDLGNSTVFDYTTNPDFWQLIDNFTQNETAEDYWYQDIAEPCHYTFCSSYIGGIPAFLGITCFLGIIGNVALGVALVACPWFWDRCQPGKVELFLLAVGGLIFTLTLPFFALGIGWRWAFDDRLCQAIHGLKSGSVFAQGLMVVGTACRSPRGLPEPLLPALLWMMGFLCAIPAVVASSTDGLCIPSRLSGFHAWSLVHVTFCLVILVLLPLIVVLATPCLEKGYPRWNVTWVFYLFWGPYGVTTFLNMIQEETVFSRNCRFLNGLNSFLRLSEAWGMLHCCLSPFLILGLGFLCRKTA